MVLAARVFPLPLHTQVWCFGLFVEEMSGALVGDLCGGLDKRRKFDSSEIKMIIDSMQLWHKMPPFPWVILEKLPPKGLQNSLAWTSEFHTLKSAKDNLRGTEQPIYIVPTTYMTQEMQDLLNTACLVKLTCLIYFHIISWMFFKDTHHAASHFLLLQQNLLQSTVSLCFVAEAFLFGLPSNWKWPGRGRKPGGAVNEMGGWMGVEWRIWSTLRAGVMCNRPAVNRTWVPLIL